VGDAVNRDVVRQGGGRRRNGSRDGGGDEFLVHAVTPAVVAHRESSSAEGILVGFSGLQQFFGKKTQQPVMLRKEYNRTPGKWLNWGRNLRLLGALWR